MSNLQLCLMQHWANCQALATLVKTLTGKAMAAPARVDEYQFSRQFHITQFECVQKKQLYLSSTSVATILHSFKEIVACVTVS